MIRDIVIRPESKTEINTDNTAAIISTTGGSASNFAVWLASLQVETHLVARVGKGDKVKLVEEFLAKGVQAHLQEDRKLPTGTIAILVEGENRTFFTERGANKNLEVGMMPVDLFGDVLYISGYTVLSVGTEATQKLIKLARHHGMTIICDPGSSSFINEYGPDNFLEAVAGSDILVPNLEEARILTGQEKTALAADQLNNDFPLVLVTMGAEGVFVKNATTAEVVDAKKTDGLDPTGAGDAFAAMFIREIIDGDRNVLEAARSACDFAADATKFLGGQPK